MTTMASCFEDSRAGSTLLSVAMSKSSSSSSDATVPTPPPETSPVDGLEHIVPQKFTGTAKMQKIVKLHSDALQAGRSDQQYLIFRPVSKDDLTNIDLARHSIGK